MEIFDKISKKASETYKGAAEIAKGAGEKTSKIAKEAKLKMKISDNKSQIDDLYQEIGKKVYQKHIADEELNIKSDLEEECKKIDELSNEIECYNNDILALSDVKICVNCNEKMELKAKFCPKCGAEQPEVKENVESEIVDSNNLQNSNLDENISGQNEQEGSIPTNNEKTENI